MDAILRRQFVDGLLPPESGEGYPCLELTAVLSSLMTHGASLVSLGVLAYSVVQFSGYIISTPFGAGPGGSVTIKAGVLEIDGGFIQAQSAAESTGSAGAITVTARRITLTGGAQISSGMRMEPKRKVLPSVAKEKTFGTKTPGMLAS